MGKHPRLNIDEEIIFDTKAKQVQKNTTHKMKTKSLTPKLIWSLANAIDAIMDTEESMYLSQDLHNTLQDFLPNSIGMTELFGLLNKGNSEEAAKRLAYKEKHGKNPPQSWYKQQRKYFLPRIIEEL
jgi:hypothetical protein